MCTDFLIVASDKSVVNGRSMEFGLDLGSEILVRAPGSKFVSPSPHGLLNGLSWTSTYGYVGLTAKDSLPIIVDGMNTAGLSTGSLWLPGSRYPKVTNNSKALTLAQFPGWVLGNFSTVAEVRSALLEGAAQVWESDWLAKYLPLHFPIHDAQGNSLVVEFLDGELHLHDNPVSVLTNAPPFPVQLQNLRNYVDLTPYDAKPIQLGSETFSQPGHGSGLRGIPGDAMPPSRFVRATYLKQFARPVANATEATSLAFHILNSVDIPKGAVRFVNETTRQEEDDYTQWTVVKDLSHTVFNVRFYEDLLIYSVNLKTLDFRAADGKTFAVPSSPGSIDLTSKLST
ncbi:choloylglycine hydrolase family protein [Myxococcus stipitatus]|uniref:choloylglycine hydrolase family protein n=1 Tax=Myxococcus stipitatus TaxID=83455 RepID=UPI0030CF119A